MAESRMRKCRNCEEPVRRLEPRDGIDLDYAWVHDNGPKIGGNPLCDIMLVAEPEDEASGDV